MADIGIHIDGEVTFQPTTGPCLMVNISKSLPGNIPYCRDVLFIHGSIESMREFARKMLAALPVEELQFYDIEDEDDPRDHEPECTCGDVDREDASGCEFHNQQSEWNRAVRRYETALELYAGWRQPDERYRTERDRSA
jgi:hypothetical protein